MFTLEKTKKENVPDNKDYPAAVFVQYPPDGDITFADIDRIKERLCCNDGSEFDKFTPVIYHTYGANLFGLVRSVDAENIMDGEIEQNSEFGKFIIEAAETAVTDIEVMYGGAVIGILLQKR